MMNQSIINSYNIKLETKILSWKGFSRQRISKTIETNNLYLTDFLNDYSAEDLTDYIIPETDKVINGINTEFEIGSATVSISLLVNKVEIYDNDLNFVGQIPILDFKEICKGWRDFLNYSNLIFYR